MIQIVKNSEPSRWKRYRKTPGASYSPTLELRKSLIREQGYICAYCMCRVKIEKSKIEHIKCRSKYPQFQLDYSNMVICCEGKTKGESHCDDSKKNSDISINLFSPSIKQHILYESKSGAIKSDLPDWDNDINSILQLNIPILKENRKQVLDGIVSILPKMRWKTAEIRKKLTEWTTKDTKGCYKEYSDIVVWFLNKKLNQL